MPAGSRRELAEAVRLGQQFLTLSREDDKVAPQIIANMDLGIVLVSRGEPKAAKQHFHEAISLYDPAEHDPLTLSYSYDPMVICAGYLAWILLASDTRIRQLNGAHAPSPRPAATGIRCRSASL